MNNSITSRLILFLTLSVGGVIALGLLVDYRLSRAQILQQLTEESQATLADVARDLEGLLGGVEGSTRLLGSILTYRDYTPAELEQLLSDAVANNRGVFGATIALNPELVDADDGFAPYYFGPAQQLQRSDLTRGNTPYWERDWFSEPVAAGEPAWTEPYFDTGGAEVFMTTYSVPVYRQRDDEIQLYAVVTADITLDDLHRYLGRLQLGQYGVGLLVSHSGQVLRSRSPGAQMEPYSELLRSPDKTRQWREIIEAATPNSAPAQNLDCELAPGSCVARVTRLRHTGWALGVVYSEQDVLASLRDYEVKALAVGALTLLTMALAVSLVTRRITRPLTALAHTADGFGEGNFDIALPRVQGRDEVSRLVNSFATMKRELTRYIADLERATASRSRLEGELSAAREIQMSMLPHGGEAAERGEQFALWAMVRPARTVGGDLYTYSLTGRKLFFAVGDVSDKGVPAALFMARAMSHLQLFEGRRPGAILAELNNALVERNDNCMFVTLIVGALDLDTLQLTFASAGHTPPILLRNGLVASLTQHSGPATGLAPDQDFPDNHLQLAPGDRLAVFTDGIDEAFNERGEMFGTARLGEHLVDSRERDLAAAGGGLIDAIDHFSRGLPQSDDITLLLLELFPGLSPTCYSGSFALDAQVAASTRQWLAQNLGEALDSTLRGELALVLEEVVTNIHKYSGLGEGDTVEIELALSAGEVNLRVRDRGVAFNPLQESRRAELGADIASAEVGGLGVHLIVRLTDWQRYARVEDYNCLELGRSLAGRVPYSE